jgi:HSP20 family protein
MLTLWNRSRPGWGLDDWFDVDGRPPLNTAVDVEEQDESYVLKADLPGVAQKDIQVSVHDGVLTLTAQREDAKSEEGKRRWHRERRFGQVTRRFNLGPGIDATKIEATHENGVLTLSLPKREESKPRQIRVHSSN